MIFGRLWTNKYQAIDGSVLADRYEALISEYSSALSKLEPAQIKQGLKMCQDDPSIHYPPGPWEFVKLVRRANGAGTRTSPQAYMPYRRKLPSKPVATKEQALAHISNIRKLLAGDAKNE